MRHVHKQAGDHIPSIADEQERELALIRDIDLGLLEQVLADLRELSAPLVTSKSLYDVAKRFLAPEDAPLFTRHLIGLGTLCRHRDIPPDAAIDILVRRLRARGWEQADIAKWREREGLLVSILKQVTVVAKEVDLSYNYANLLSSAQIITDMRPIYDDDHTAIIGAIIANILRLEYFSESGRHGLSIALDDRDIRRLQRSCEEALKKTEVAQAFLSANEKTVVKHGEDVDVFSDR